MPEVAKATKLGRFGVLRLS